MSDTPSSRQQIQYLQQVFVAKRLEATWKKTVRTALRNQDVSDLHDYLDIHRNRQAFSERLRDSILSGNFRPREPFELRVEKQLGITRRVSMPAAQDALVLQLLAEAMTGPLRAKRPSERSYYSRSHAPPRDVDIDDTFDYPWWRLWPQYQQRILQFTEVFPVVVNTDIANYFDSIPLDKLRDQLASVGNFSTELLDFLFFLLEPFLWRDRYGPTPRVGLPQLNLDAPRLLAHVYLYKLDEHMTYRVNDNFVRWMDDVNFGASSVGEAKRVLGEIQLLLESLSLRINASKSQILDASAAKTYFQGQENRRLTILANSRKAGTSLLAGQRNRKLRRWFRRFVANPRPGAWEKVLKRYINELSEYGDPCVERYISGWLASRPGLRGTLFRYLLRLGYSPKRFKLVTAFLTGDDCLDDAAAFQAAKLIVDWRIPPRSRNIRRIPDLVADFVPRRNASSARFLAGLWLNAKYGSVNHLTNYIFDHIEAWRASDFAARQVAAVSPLLRLHDQDRLRRRLAQSGSLSGLEVVASLDEIRKLPLLDQQLKAYLYEQPKNGVYPFPKITILAALLDEESQLKLKSKLLSDLNPVINDVLLSKRLSSLLKT